jgi:uridine kinase
MSLSSSLPNIPGKWFGCNYNEFANEPDSHTTPPRFAKPFIIGVGGGSASGKTSVCELIMEELQNHRVAIISLDSFYLPLTCEQLKNVAEYNFDHPDAWDWDLLLQTVRALSEGKRVEIPEYDFSTHSRKPETHSLYGLDVILLEGIFVFHSPQLRDLIDMKIFVDTDSDTRLVRRVRRDMQFRGRTLESILAQYEKFVKPCFDNYIWPTKKYADVIIPRGKDNTVAIDLIVQHIRGKLNERQQLMNSQFNHFKHIQKSTPKKNL